MLTILAIYYQTIRYPGGMDAVYESLVNVDRAFAQLNVKFDYRLFHWKILIEILMLSASIHITFAALCTHYHVELFVAIVYELFARFYPIFVINAALLMFINLCCLLKSKFTALKKMLCDFHGTHAHTACCDEVWKVKLVQTATRTFHSELRQIVGVYESLYGIVNQLNNIFGLTNLASLSFLAISLTCHLFLLVKILMENTASIDGTIFELFGVFFNQTIKVDLIIFYPIRLVSAIWMLVLLAYITIICHWTAAEANAISALMHETVTKHEMDDAMPIDVSCFA